MLMKRAEGNRQYSSFVRNGVKMIAVVSTIPWISPLVHLFPVSEEVKKQTKQFTEIGAAQYHQRRVKGTEPNDMFTHLIAGAEKEGYEQGSSH
jgi:hypothetical protein